LSSLFAGVSRNKFSFRCALDGSCYAQVAKTPRKVEPEAIRKLFVHLRHGAFFYSIGSIVKRAHSNSLSQSRWNWCAIRLAT